MVRLRQRPPGAKFSALTTLGLPPDGQLPDAGQREAPGRLLDVRAAAAALDDGRSLAHATQDVRACYLGGRELAEIHPLAMISAAIADAERVAVSLDKARKITTLGQLMLAWKGDSTAGRGSRYGESRRLSSGRRPA